MRTAGRYASTFLAALALAALPLSQAGAQLNAPVEPASSYANGARAEQLRARARSMLSDRDRYREAAQLLEQASELTPVEEAVRVDDLHLAASLLFYSGAAVSAQAVMVEAADAALARGDVFTAANTLVDAGWIAGQRRSPDQARELVFRALHLAASPLLPDDQRDAIRKRVVLAGGQHTATLSDEAGRRTGWSPAAERATPARAVSPTAH